VGLSFLLLLHFLQQGVETPVLLFGLEPVSIDPRGQRFQLGRVEVDGSPLRITAPGHQTCLLQHLNVLRDRLFGDLERLRQLVDGGRAPAQSGDDPATHRVGQGGEGPVEPIVRGGIDDHFMCCLVNCSLYQPTD
jgi:hypothetical protein